MNGPVIGRLQACVVAFVAAGSLALASPALAQRVRDDRPARFYVSLGGFATFDRFANDRQMLVTGWTVGAEAGIGTFLTPRWSVEFDAAASRWITSPVGGQTFPFRPGGINYVGDVRVQTWHKIDTGAILLAFHPSHRGRIRLAYGAGVAFVRLRFETDQDVTYQPSGNVVHTVLQRSDLLLAPVFQVEASIRMTRRLAIVPHFQAAAFQSDMYYPGIIGDAVAGPGVFVFRPGVSLRAHF